MCAGSSRCRTVAFAQMVAQNPKLAVFGSVKSAIDSLRPSMYLSNKKCLLPLVFCFFLVFMVLFFTADSNLDPRQLTFSSSGKQPKKIFSRVINWNHDHLSCKPQVQDKFVGILSDSKIALTVLDPRILSQYLSSKEYSSFQKRNIRIETSSAVSTFGVELEDADKLINDKVIADKLVSLNFQRYLINASDPRINESNASVPLTTHLFYLGQRNLIHVVVLVPLENYIWISGIPKLTGILSAKIGLDQILVSGKESILHKPHTSTIHSCSSTFKIPSKTFSFIVELESAEFIGCDRELASTLKKEYSKQSEDNPLIDHAFKRALVELNNVFQAVAIPFWISSGTLLGWYRNCAIIPYTSDIDFTTNINDFSEDILSVFQGLEELKLSLIYGMPSNGYQLAFYIEQYRIDLFFNYEEKDHVWFAGHINRKTYFHYKYPKFKLCSAALLGEKVLVPCSPLETVVAEYGKDWKTPVSEWVYNKSPFNMGPILTWRDEELEEMRQTHRKI